MLKIGDYVQVKDSFTNEAGELVTDWSGKVVEIYEEDKTFLMEFDAPTLLSLSDKYIIDCDDMGAEPYEYRLLFSDVKLIERRDTDEELKKAIQIMDDRVNQLLFGDEVSEEDSRQLFREFTESESYRQLTDLEKDRADFIIPCTIDYLHNYIGVGLENCSTGDIGEVCLDIVPRKVSSEIEIFESWGDLLMLFFQYLEDTKSIEQAPKIIAYLKKIKSRIPKLAANPDNWGMAKTFTMSAFDAGVDIHDQEAFNQYMEEFNQAIAHQLQEEEQQQPIDDEAFRSFKRNDKVSVEYIDGRIVENIKFKKVKQDLLDNKCVLI